MRLLYVFPEAFPLPRARSVQVSRSIEALVAQGTDVQFISRAGLQLPTPQNQAFPGLPADAPFSWLEMSAYWRAGHFGPASSHFFHANIGRWLKSQLRYNPPSFDCVLVRHLKSIAPLKHLLPKVPLIYEAHEVFAHTAPLDRQNRIRNLERQALQHADALIANSAATAQTIQAEYGWSKPLLVLPNGVQWPTHVPDKFNPANPNSPREIIYAGSFFGWKGVSDFWQALQRLPKKLSDINNHTSAPRLHATLVGGEPDNLKTLASDLHQVESLPNGALQGLLPNGMGVTLMPRQPAPFIQSLLLHAHIAVLPNRPEVESRFTSPIKLFEYMAAGCAVIASDLPALREIVDEKSARLFTAGQPDALAQAILHLLNNPQQCAQLAAAARLRAEQYTWQARATRQLEFMRGLVGAE